MFKNALALPLIALLAVAFLPSLASAQLLDLTDFYDSTCSRYGAYCNQATTPPDLYHYLQENPQQNANYQYYQSHPYTYQYSYYQYYTTSTVPQYYGIAYAYSASAYCTCNEPGGGVNHNHFTCYDSYNNLVADRWCAENEICTGSSTYPNWPCSTNYNYYYPYYYSAQYGNLNVRVTDCSTGSPINGAYVNAACAEDPAGYTDGSGYASFSGIPIGGCSITASASNYNSQSTSANIQCSQTAYASICLNRIVTTTTTTVPWCSAGYTGVYQCSSGWLQQQYRYTDCTNTWINQQFCSNGCSGNSCLSCSSGFTNSYRCDGQWRQRLYQNADCSVYWSNVEYCSNTCSANGCGGNCGVTVSATTPSDAYVGESISTTITMFNYGDGGSYVTVNPFVCKDDGSYCTAMNCVPGTTYLAGRDSGYMTCTKAVDTEGYYKIKVTYADCSSNPTVYSGSFRVRNKFQCSPRSLENYQCYGDDLKQEYQNADCSKSWQLVKHCESGCSGSECKEKTTAIPLVSLQKEYDVKACEVNSFTFDVINVGNAKSTFNLVATGSASNWIKFLNAVDVEANSRTSVNAYATVPCEAGSEDFTITASSDSEKSSASSNLQVAEKSWFTGLLTLPVLPYKMIGYVLIGLLVILLLALLLLWMMKGKRRSGCGAEAFR